MVCTAILLRNSRRNQRQQIGFKLIESGRRGLDAFLRSDYMLQDQACAVLGGQFSGKAGHQVSWPPAGLRRRGWCGWQFAVVAADRVGPDDADRHIGGAQHGLGH
jgi:hypothetical protein